MFGNMRLQITLQSILSIALILTVGLVPAPAYAQDMTGGDEVQIEEWQVPWDGTRPRDPYVGPDGKVWFVGQTGHYAAYLDPGTGEFNRYDLPEGAGPHNLVVDDEGIVWYTGNRVGDLGRIDPASGAIQTFPLPDPDARDPHTLVFAEGDEMWFTVQNGNFIGRFSRDTHEFDLVRTPTVETQRGMGSSRPYGIKMDSQNRPWVVLFNTNQIAMVEEETMDLVTYDLPEGARPRRLVISSDDMIWYVDYARGYLGKLDPETGDVQEWENPSGSESRPYAVEIDPDDRIWYVETGVRPNRFVGFDTRTEEVFSVTDIPSGGGSVRHMFYDAETNSIWFGADTNTVGRAKLPPLSGRITTDRD